MGISSYNKKHTPFFGGDITWGHCSSSLDQSYHMNPTTHRKLRIHPWNMSIGKIAELFCFKRNIALYKSNDLIQFLFISPVSELAWVNPVSTLMVFGPWHANNAVSLYMKIISPFSRQHLPGVPTAQDAIINCEERGCPQSSICLQVCICAARLLRLPRFRNRRGNGRRNPEPIPKI